MSAREIGLFPLASVLVPGELMPLHIFEERYKSLVADCRQEDGEFALLYSDSDGARELGDDRPGRRGARDVRRRPDEHRRSRAARSSGSSG